MDQIHASTRTASFLCNNGSDLNMLVTKGLCWRSLVPVTLLGVLVQENGPSSLSCLTFLLDRNTQGGKVEIVVEPQLGHTVFHELAKLDGDRQDGLTISRALALCAEYLQPTPNLLNGQSLPYQDGDDSVEGCGGNTALITPFSKATSRSSIISSRQLRLSTSKSRMGWA